MPLSLDLQSLRHAYAEGDLTPVQVIGLVYERIERYADPAVWIYLAPQAESLAQAQAVMEKGAAEQPLYGIPLAIKDNLDWAGVPTTAGCPAFAYVPEVSATVVAKLIAAGAIPIGKTNLDQFATGLVGTRSPYGVCRNPFDPDYIPGGSSSGSAVAVSAGLVSFSLGTDTAGSGRVPAAFNQIVGLKPTRGYLSTQGLVPAVRSLDCVAIFALTCADAQAVLDVAAGFDPLDPFSQTPHWQDLPPRVRVGVPPLAQLDFAGNGVAAHNYDRALQRLADLGCTLVTMDLEPFLAVGALLYEGAWLAARTAAVGDFLRQPQAGVDPVVRQIILAGQGISGVKVFQDMHHLASLKRQTEAQWEQMDLLALPTTGTIYRVAEVMANPVALNRNLGRYTNFVNLLDLCALAVPSGLQPNGLPTGMTLMAPAGRDRGLCAWGHRYQESLGGTLGATGIAYGGIHP
ncbi:allophanate hydrolase [Gloeomargarita lithophora Alchichica-D10]|uniref:Allophanate hydrolase n=1 Tax=Gloeomargarita lithophora Alchichica-D10 TaxID=1188229 RepID=A0A1J0AEF0_9CYAN|nr:allophanate hydrolase [Gloeomargarita lithophora]APB34309.1 allophanate hydrolase [Gloeomargarita lithophora Alchichica-D10]